ncbi:hypothetical protein PGT21_005247 [Puccinia graminis f. sp. tritici]|uniref:Uncharacterized protein n=1 Tax=Puccinia graminis f. sp. tritici TaxID=56615 RepID=A0A5B0PQ33_PUCGR|nr:hypothetical protein PGT21_005247 [Puccinia graminis f. sp. tritici]
MYSRDWNLVEDEYIQSQIKKITADNPGAKRPPLFVHFRSLLSAAKSFTGEDQSPIKPLKIAERSPSFGLDSTCLPFNNPREAVSISPPPPSRKKKPTVPKGPEKPPKPPAKGENQPPKPPAKGQKQPPKPHAKTPRQPLKPKISKKSGSGSTNEIPWDRMLAFQQANYEKDSERRAKEMSELAKKCPGFASNYLNLKGLGGSTASLSSSAREARVTTAHQTKLPRRLQSSPTMPSGYALDNLAPAAPAQPQKLLEPTRRRSSRKSAGVLVPRN